MAETIEQLRARVAELEQKDEKHQGIAEGTLQCLTFGCGFGERKAKFRKEVANRYFKDPQGNLTDRVENSTTYWHLLDQDPDATKCPECKAPLNQLHPGSQSVFPEGYRFQFQNRSSVGAGMRGNS